MTSVIISSSFGDTPFDVLKKQRGRRPITIVELELDFCANTYGVSPCTASGSAGSECYNGFFTCQDKPNYVKTTKVYRFCENIEGIPAGVTIFPALENISIAPTKLGLDSLGERASVTVTFRDFPHHDRGIDPYVSTRSYDPSEQGSFFGKLKARNPYVINRVLRIKTGYIDENGFDTNFDTDFETRTYFISRFDAVDANGRVRIVAKDILKLADDAKLPRPSDGELEFDITDSDTSLTLTSGYTTTYPTSGTIRISDELITYTGKSGDTLTGLQRGVENTTAISHSAQDTVQLCLVYSLQTPTAIVKDMFVNYADIDASYIDDAQWEEERALYLSTYRFSSIIAEPSDVKEIVEEVLTACGSYVWWDELTQKIKFRVAFPINQRTPLTDLNDTDHIIERSLSVKDDEKKRVSEVISYYRQYNPIDGVNKENFSRVYVQVDSDSEGVNAYGVKAPKEIINRWSVFAGDVVEVSGRNLFLYKDTPKNVTFRVDAKDSDIEVGDFIRITSRLLQGASGAEEPVNFIVTKRLERKQGSEYEYEALQFGQRLNVAFIGPNSLGDYTAESEENRTKYAFISNNSGLMSNGDDGYTIG